MAGEVNLAVMTQAQTALLEWGRAKVNAERAAEVPPLAPITLQQYADARFLREVIQELRRYAEVENFASVQAQFNALSAADKLKTLTLTVT